MLSLPPPTSPFLSRREGAEGAAGKVRAVLTPGPSPALREALTPGPSPALRERGDLASIAPAPLIPPPSTPVVRERKGLRGR